MGGKASALQAMNLCSKRKPIDDVKSCVLKINTEGPGWQKVVMKVLSSIHGVYNFKMKEDGTLVVSGKVAPVLLLKILGKAGKRAEILMWKFGECSSNLFMNPSPSGGGMSNTYRGYGNKNNNNNNNNYFGNNYYGYGDYQGYYGGSGGAGLHCGHNHGYDHGDGSSYMGGNNYIHGGECSHAPPWHHGIPIMDSSHDHTHDVHGHSHDMHGHSHDVDGHKHDAHDHKHDVAAEKSVSSASKQVQESNSSPPDKEGKATCCKMM